jgi:ABC-type uncharacterized transport system permease subunit
LRLDLRKIQGPPRGAPAPPHGHRDVQSWLGINSLAFWLISLSAVVFGRWNPIGAVIAALLFGHAGTVRIVFETRIPLPVQFVQMFPYVLALVVLAGLAGRACAPAADGRRFENSEG